ncbi:divergent polysaccharide deacetylase family protein [Marivibrio halodurans]|uniref:Divergent polysaccharide deacetylase family protein n=1 Tax=Marivibrio halodurans TaxID=2039722 RepID=A0A8J7V2N6_9PROT|nr:divergent polysaccharide deacetylase family protein [Marivibrio halodurans]MBP5859006.1 divergent polysaccharide deacetylase family protein [Marivibrio halodurans]
MSRSEGGSPFSRLMARVRGKTVATPTKFPDRTSETDDDDDIPAHLKPTFLERHGQRIALAAGYFLFVAAIAGTGLYLWLNEDTILEAEKARRPSLLVEDLRPEIVRVGADGEEASPETAAPTPAGAAPEGEESGNQEANLQQDEPERTAGAEQAPVEGAEAPETADAEQAAEDVALLAPHPDPALVEESPTGPLPRIAADGREPWRVYSRPFNALETRPRIAIVVTDVGIADDTTAQAIAMPGPVTLAMASYSRKLTEYIAAARDRGHEVLLTLPMEPRDYPRSDPGPYALMTTIDDAANMERLNWVLSRATGYIGVANYQGSAFTANATALQPIMTSLADRGLVYFDTLEDATSAAPRIATGVGAPAVTADIVADDTLSRAAILRKLNEAEVIAKARETAIVLVRPYPVSIARVQSWAKELQSRGIVLAPLSAVIRARASSS